MTGDPSWPSSMVRFMSRTEGRSRSWKKTPSLTFAASAAAISASARAVVTSSGFSTRTCSPRRAAGHALLTVKPRRAADGDHVHRPMREKLLEVVVGDGTVLPREVHGFVTICANDRAAI